MALGHVRGRLGGSGAVLGESQQGLRHSEPPLGAFNLKVILVLGSGATAGGGFHIVHGTSRLPVPMDGNFFESLAAKRAFTSSQFPALAHYRGHSPSLVSLEATWSSIDLLVKLCLGGVLTQEHDLAEIAHHLEQRASGDGSYREKMRHEPVESRAPSLAGWELLHLVREVIGGVKPVGGSLPLGDVVHRLRSAELLRAVISFNYDLSIEFILQEELFYPGLEVGLDRRIPLYKLHGSLNWEERPGRVALAEDRLKAVEVQYGVDGWVQPCIIGPAAFKQDITFDLLTTGKPGFYKRLWGRAWEELTEPETCALVIVGFSFAPGDLHAREFFRSASRRRGGFAKVVYCHKDAGSGAGTTARETFDGCGDFYESNGGVERLVNELDGLIDWIGH